MKYWVSFRSKCLTTLIVVISLMVVFLAGRDVYNTIVSSKKRMVTMTIPPLTLFMTGNRKNQIMPYTGTQVFSICGGGTIDDNTLQHVVAKTLSTAMTPSKLEVGKGLNVIVVRALSSGPPYEDTYSDFLMTTVKGVSTAVTVITFNREQSNSIDKIMIPELKISIEDYIKTCHLVMLPGGNQYNYVSLWMGTKLGNAIEALIARGGSVWGTSAGAVVMGQYYYAAMTSMQLESADALKNPYTSILTLGGMRNDTYPSISRSCLQIEPLRHTVIEGHMDTRKRMGRLVTMMGRIMKDGNDEAVRGIGLEEHSSVVMEKVNGDWVASIFGSRLNKRDKNNVSFLSAPYGLPDRCTLNSPLIWDKNREAVKVSMYTGDTSGVVRFNISKWTPVTRPSRSYSISVLSDGIHEKNKEK